MNHFIRIKIRGQNTLQAQTKMGKECAPPVGSGDETGCSRLGRGKRLTQAPDTGRDVLMPCQACHYLKPRKFSQVLALEEAETLWSTPPCRVRKAGPRERLVKQWTNLPSMSCCLLSRDLVGLWVVSHEESETPGAARSKQKRFPFGFR